MTIKDIAKAAGVSTATVSRVLNNPDAVSDKRRVHVLQTIEKLQYTPNLLARELKTNSTKVIGVLLPDIKNTFAPSVIENIVQTMNQHDYHTLLCITNADPLLERQCLQMLIRKRVEGLVFLGSRHYNGENDNYIEQLAQKIPVIMIDYLDKPSVSHVMVNEVEGAYQATKYLLQLGHKRIAFLNGDPDGYTTYHYKLQGFLRAMNELPADSISYRQILVSPDYMGGYDAASILLKQNSWRPTAIFAAGDQIAVGVYRAAQEIGIAIPKELSVIGFSGSLVSMSVHPPLCTVAQFPKEIGEQTALLMLRFLQGKQHPPYDMILAPKVLQRQSCCPPPEER